MKMKRSRQGERGSALLLTTIISLVIMGITGAYLAVSLVTQKSTTNSMFGIQALYAAEAGASAYISALNANIKDPKTVPLPNLATFPTTYNGAAYSIQDDLDRPVPGFRRLTVTGTFANVSRRVEVILTGSPGGVFWNAIFAGNKPPNGGAPDPYTLWLSGQNGNSDTVKGDIYSGGDFKADNGATMQDYTGQGTANVMYAGNTNMTGTNMTQGSQENLLLPRNGNQESIWEQKAKAMQSVSDRRDTTDGVAYIDVAYDMAKMSGGSKNKWIDGSAAFQIDQPDQPSHIFRMDPTSTGSANLRTEVYEYTVSAKHDFYIEDSTTTSLGSEKLGVAINGDSNATAVNIGPEGNKAVYFVDGNLRVSSEPVKSFQYKSTDGSALQMTYVVKGNVSLTDNILYQSYMSKTDGVAYIAITDPEFPNTTARDFMGLGTDALPKGSGNMSVDAFVAAFNQRAKNAGTDSNGNPKIRTLDFSNPADFERASQEYNKSYGSGNVYFGDPGSGTVEHFEGFLYAENNFYATNLDSTTASGGTQKIEIWGNMTAGNKVNIVRDNTKYGYIPLDVTLDPLIMAGKGPPALPTTPGFAATEYTVASWKQVR